MKWTQLPLMVKKAVEEWDSLSEDVRKGVEALLGGADEGRT